jgi:hypothetical protein
LLIITGIILKQILVLFQLQQQLHKLLKLIQKLKLKIMKNYLQLWLLPILILLFAYQGHAQQSICFGDTKNYIVNGPGSGPVGSTYSWSLVGTNASNYAGTTNLASVSANSIQINWGTTPAGTYTLQVIETNNSCPGEPVTLTVTINPLNTASVASSTPTLCINTPLTAITHSTTGATGIGTPSGLPSGVTASWENDVITISGTPTEAGQFSYSIPLTGGCGSVIATGTINVTPANTVSVASSTPTLCINTPLTAITHSTTGATGIGTPSGLPSGVTAFWENDVITISGTPTEAGQFSYSIPLTGGCGSVIATGTINVTPANTITLTSTAETTNQTVCINNAVVNITYNTTGANGANFSNLPNGVNGVFNAGVITISGTPSVAGVFEYTVTLTGGCGAVESTGTINVNPTPVTTPISFN